MTTDISKIIDALEDLKSDETKKRLASVSQIGAISKIFGPEKTRQLIVPFLREYEDEDEEILIELCSQLYQIAKVLPDKDNSIPELIGYFNIVLNYDDFSVLNEGMKNLELIVKEFNVKHECLILLAKKLVSQNTMKAYISALRICCRFANNIPPKFNADITKIINDGSTHKAILVRTETAICLREILVEGGPYEFAAINALKKLVKDPQSSVQVFAFESLCWKTHSKQYFQTSIYSLFMSCLEVKNWRIRFVLVRQIVGILNSLELKSRKQIILFYSKCLNDQEVQVSMLALQTLKNVIPLIENDDLVDRILPELAKSVSNDNVDVKLALCSSVCYLAPSLVKLNDNFSQLKSIIMNLIKDQNSEIKVQLLLSIEPYLKTTASQNTTLTFMAFINELLNDKNWKIRINAIKALECFIIKFPEEFANDEKTLKIFHEKMTDRIANIRKAAIISFRNISVNQGTQWCEKYFLPLLNTFLENNNYLYRINYMYGISEIYNLLPPAQQNKQIDNLVKLVKDPVPNLRYHAFMLLIKLAQSGEDKALEEKVKKLAEGSSNDVDGEVKRIAKVIGATKDIKSISEKLPDLEIK